MAISAIRPNPVPRTICPASHPAMRPTNNMIKRVSADIGVPPARSPGAFGCAGAQKFCSLLVFSGPVRKRYHAVIKMTVARAPRGIMKARAGWPRLLYALAESRRLHGRGRGYQQCPDQSVLDHVGSGWRYNTMHGFGSLGQHSGRAF